MSDTEITVTEEMIKAVAAHNAAERKRRDEELSRRARERWDRQEKEIREKVRDIMYPSFMTEAQFDLLDSAFREYHEEW